MVNVIVNADDFGATLGLNDAIIKAHKNGIVNSTSLMVTLKYVKEAVESAKQLPNLKVGLHLNLTNEYCASNPKKISLLVDEKGKFKNGFLNLLILSFLHPFKLRKQILHETIAQVLLFKKTGLTLSHIDSHRHVHAIPAIFSIVKKVAKKYNIPRIRVINENFLHTIKCNNDKSYLFDGGLIKLIVLKTCYYLNHYKNGTYFYTIMYTGKIFKSRFKNFKIPKGYDNLEIGIHPGNPQLDKEDKTGVYDPYVLLENRTKEFETVMDKTLLEEII